MEYTNQYWSNDFETSTNVDASIGSLSSTFLLKTGGTISGDVTLDGSLILRGFNDTSLFWISINAAAEPSAHIVQ